jgi:DNA-binding CsgD family transcriptional regulator
MRSSQQDLSELCIDTLYKSLGEPTQLLTALRQVRVLAEATGATYLHATPQGEIKVYVADGYDESTMELYAQHYVNIDPARDPMLDAAPGEWSCTDDSMLDPKKGWHREFANDFAPMAGLRWVRSNKVLQSRDRLAFVSVQRPAEAKTFDAKVLRRLDALLPHLNRVSRLMIDLEPQLPAVRSGLAILEHVQHAVLAVDGTGIVRYANPAAVDFLADRPGRSARPFRLQANRLRFFGATAACYERALSLASVKERGLRFAFAAPPREGSVFAVPTGGRGAVKSIQVRVIPLHDSLEHWMLSSEPLVLIFLSETCKRDPRDMQRLFGLTEAEADLTALLASGHTVEQCAAERGVRMSTVRSQIQSIFDKTEAASISQLISISVALPPMRR